MMDSDDSGFYNKADMDKDGKVSPRVGKDKKIVQEKDLSDGRDEAQKIKDQMEKEKAAQIEEINLMNEWKRRQEEKDKEGTASNNLIDKMRMDQARLRAEMEESGNSSSLSVQKPGVSKPEEESAYSDSFDDVSISGSAKRIEGNLAGKLKKRPNVEDSLKSDTSGYSVSNSKSANELKSASRIGESSDVYEDDEFESLSKSHKEMNKVLPTVKKLETLKSLGSGSSPTKQVPVASLGIASIH